VPCVFRANQLCLGFSEKAEVMGDEMKEVVAPLEFRVFQLLVAVEVGPSAVKPLFGDNRFSPLATIRILH
ncbi:MAG: hypothetical protein L0Z07_03945, partial [Planctomycetes bacterium]|nr:hypothetical protein [Planctomycetota bacterium]